MAGIRGRDTKPEVLVRKALFARGFRYRKNCGELPGKPDIKLSKYRAVVLVHGCFWHGHACRYYRVPKSNTGFWVHKINTNRIRDAHDILALLDAGWRVCVVWECVTRGAAFKDSTPEIIDLLSNWITGSEPFLELYDQKAMQKSLGTDFQGVNPLGVNTNIDLFVAERNATYETNTRN